MEVGTRNGNTLRALEEADEEDVALVLNDFGLSEVEVSVYQASLSLGSRPASVIAQKSGLKRGHTYNVLQSLMNKGIVQEFVKGGVRHFTCCPPASLVSMLEDRERELIEKKKRLLQIVPQLENLRNKISGQPKVRFFRGLAGVKEIFEDILRTGEDMYGIMDLRYSFSVNDEDTVADRWHEHFIERRAEKGMWYRGILNRSPESDHAVRTRSSVQRKLKMIEGLEIPAEINVYGPKTAITSTYHDTVGIIIECPHIADSLRAIHQALWQVLPDYELDDQAETTPE